LLPYVTITKDSDFYKHFLLKGAPKQILFITTGNIVNRKLIKLFELKFQTIETHFNCDKNIIELSENYIKVLN